MYWLLRRSLARLENANMYRLPSLVVRRTAANDCNVIPFTIVSHLIVWELLAVSDGSQSEPPDELQWLHLLVRLNY